MDSQSKLRLVCEACSVVLLHKNGGELSHICSTKTMVCTAPLCLEVLIDGGLGAKQGPELGWEDWANSFTQRTDLLREQNHFKAEVFRTTTAWHVPLPAREGRFLIGPAVQSIPWEDFDPQMDCYISLPFRGEYRWILLQSTEQNHRVSPLPIGRGDVCLGRSTDKRNVPTQEWEVLQDGDVISLGFEVKLQYRCANGTTKVENGTLLRVRAEQEPVHQFVRQSACLGLIVSRELKDGTFCEQNSKYAQLAALWGPPPKVNEKQSNQTRPKRYEAMHHVLLFLVSAGVLNDTFPGLSRHPDDWDGDAKAWFPLLCVAAANLYFDDGNANDGNALKSAAKYGVQWILSDSIRSSAKRNRDQLYDLFSDKLVLRQIGVLLQEIETGAASCSIGGQIELESDQHIDLLRSDNTFKNVYELSSQYSYGKVRSIGNLWVLEPSGHAVEFELLHLNGVAIAESFIHILHDGDVLGFGNRSSISQIRLSCEGDRWNTPPNTQKESLCLVGAIKLGERLQKQYYELRTGVGRELQACVDAVTNQLDLGLTELAYALMLCPANFTEKRNGMYDKWRDATNADDLIRAGQVGIPPVRLLSQGNLRLSLVLCLWALRNCESHFGYDPWSKKIGRGLTWMAVGAATNLIWDWLQKYAVKE